ncbi:MAG: hypothetical protein GY801_04225 [bacterium]|nr:hypothetical protein [bacterium]
MVKGKKMYFVVLSMIVLASCATMQGDWEKALSENTIPAYESFLQKHHQGEFTQEAQNSLSELYLQRDWQTAQRTATIMAYDTFLQKHPEGAFAQEARERREELHDWQTAQTTDTIAAYETFLQKHPQGMLEKKAHTRVEELDWQTAQTADTIGAFDVFLQKHPEGTLARKARKRREELHDWQTAQNTHTSAAYETFLQKHPEGAFAREGRKRIYDFVVEAAPSFDGKVLNYSDLWEYAQLGMTTEQIRKIFKGRIEEKQNNKLEIATCKLDGREDEYIATFRFTNDRTLEEIVLEAKEYTDVPKLKKQFGSVVQYMSEFLAKQKPGECMINNNSTSIAGEAGTYTTDSIIWRFSDIRIGVRLRVNPEQSEKSVLQIFSYQPEKE